ncbi:MAG: DUF167 domain-containing protein [Patescibacteria group bacterium]
MIISVKVKTKAKENKLTPPESKLWPVTETEIYTASVKELPVHGKANLAVQKLLANHFRVTLEEVELIRGATSKLKVFSIST